MAWLNDFPSEVELLERQSFINLLGVAIPLMERKTLEELKILFEEQKQLGEEVVNITKNPSAGASEVITALRAYCDSRLKNIQHMLRAYQKR